MHLCAYWDCPIEIDEDRAFCQEHSLEIIKERINQCPKCGRYKDSKFDLCPDCKHGRPIADWKIISRTTKATALLEMETKARLYRNRTAQTNGYERLEPIKIGDKRALMTNSAQEARCPFCRSSNLIYKSVMRYYQCNTCKNTFIDPVYSYGEEKERRPEVEPGMPLAQEIFGQPKLESKNEKEINVDIVRKPRPTKLGWLILLLVFTLIISIVIVACEALGIQIQVN